MFNPWIFFREHQWAVVAVIAIIGLICFTINTINDRKKRDPNKETFRVISDNLIRARAGAAGKYSKAPDSDIYQKKRGTGEDYHVS